MSSLILPHKTPSVGSITKKIMAINPELSADQMIAIVKQSLYTQGGSENQFGNAEVIDETKAIALAKATLTQH